MGDRLGCENDLPAFPTPSLGSEHGPLGSLVCGISGCCVLKVPSSATAANDTAPVRKLHQWIALGVAFRSSQSLAASRGAQEGSLGRALHPAMHLCTGCMGALPGWPHDGPTGLGRGAEGVY